LQEGIKKITGIKPEFAEFDLQDKQKLEDFFKKYTNIEAIIHFAAYKAVGESVQKPLMYYQNNLISLINLLEMMEKYDTKSFVFSSSCTVYGEPDELPVKESSPIKPATSPYGNTKQIAEEIIRDYMKVKSDLKSALKEMIKLSSLDQSSKSRYELGSIERQFSEVMLDFHAPEDEPQ